MRFPSAWAATVLLLLVCSGDARAQSVYSYVGDVGSDFVLLAWGSTDGNGRNTIGRDSTPLGSAQVRIGDRTVTVADHNWVVVKDLKPDTEYPYEIDLNGKRIGGSVLRTNPIEPTKLCFFVIGDWGSGDDRQYRLADVMRSEFEKRAKSDNPVRFILSMGDNIYGEISFTRGFHGTGSDDHDWDKKFFRPYQSLIARIPFHPVLGNHDGNETEKQEDTAAYLDNFFFPNNEPARYYHFTYGTLADFFALDSTRNNQSGPPTPAYGPGSPQFAWMRNVFPASKAMWKIPYFHHPPFNAGPLHPSSVNDLRHWVDLFAQTGVKVVFSGHEHNFQYSEVNAATSNIEFVVSGSGGEIRTGDVRASMAANHVQGWVSAIEFCVVEIEGKTMRITPLSFAPLTVRDRNGAALPMPLTVTLP